MFADIGTQPFNLPEGIIEWHREDARHECLHASLDLAKVV